MGKPSCWIFLILLILFTSKINGQDKPQVVKVEAFDSSSLRVLYPSPDKLKSITQALSLIEDFLKKRELTYIDSLPDVAKEILGFIFDFAPPKNSLYEIVAVNASGINRFIFKINAYLVFKNSPLKLYQGLFELAIDLQKKKIIFPVYNSSYSTVNYANISYHFKKSDQKAYLTNLKKGDRYTSLILKRIKEKCPDFIPPLKRLSYIIANGYFDGLEYFGIHNYLITSRFFRTGNTIVDVAANGFYKHELIHYVFSNYKFCQFLNEGIATFLSGEARFGEDITDILKRTQDRIRNDEKFASVLNGKNFLPDPSLGSEMYLISAMLINDYYKKMGEEKFYKVLIRDLIALTDDEALQFFKRELNINQISDWILKRVDTVER